MASSHAPAAAGQSDSEYEAHLAWVRSLQLQRASMRESSRSMNSSSMGFQELSDPLALSRTETGQQSDAWPQTARTRVEGEMTAAFDRALDFEEFDEPVYRGLQLGSFPADTVAFEDQEVTDDAPVYRSLGGLGLGLGGDEGMDDDDDGDDTAWLASMPPLVMRQRAGELNVGFGGFDGFGS
eukprot:4849521-Prymnesium_polylepis.1